MSPTTGEAPISQWQFLRTRADEERQHPVSPERRKDQRQHPSTPSSQPANFAGISEIEMAFSIGSMLNTGRPVSMPRTTCVSVEVTDPGAPATDDNVGRGVAPEQTPVEKRSGLRRP